MSLASTISGLPKWRQFKPEVILLAVGWYLRLSLSYGPAGYLLYFGKSFWQVPSLKR